MDVRARLANGDLWAKFHSNTTEMVVTKTGRKMFPKLEYIIEGLDPNHAYGLVLQIEQVDDNRYVRSTFLAPSLSFSSCFACPFCFPTLTTFLVWRYNRNKVFD
ncbi:T-box [Cooperia oncophora]